MIRRKALDDCRPDEMEQNSERFVELADSGQVLLDQVTVKIDTQ